LAELQIRGHPFHIPEINTQVHLKVVGSTIALGRVLKLALAPHVSTTASGILEHARYPA